MPIHDGLQVTRRIMALAAALSLVAVHASAQTRYCGPRDDVLKHLEKRFGETRQSVGLGVNGTLFEVLASDETGSWTIITTTAQGQTCLVASGQAFARVAKVRPVEGDPL